MPDIDLDAIAQAQAESLKKLEHLQTEYLGALTDVWNGLLQQQQTLTQQWQEGQAQLLSGLGACAQPGTGSKGS